MKWIKRLSIFTLLMLIAGVGAIGVAYLSVQQDLPDVSSLKEVKLQTPLRIYSKDGKLISQFGEKRRIPVTIDEVPQALIDAILATEDARFYEHAGIDPIGILRAASILITTGKKSQGASTITMQVARNFFLTREKTYLRKVKEIFIALHIETLLSKNDILELYLNRSFLGNRAYGVGAAAQVYYGKELHELNLAQLAMIAGLPQSPSAANPIRNPARALKRRNVVLARMLDEAFISGEEFATYSAMPVTAKYHGAEIDLYAPYISEMVRDYMVETYGEEASYTEGFDVYTTIDSNTQLLAQQSLMDNVYAYDMRHGYRGPLATVDATELNKLDTLTAQNDTNELTQWVSQQLKPYPEEQDLIPAVVTSIDETSANLLSHTGPLTLNWDGIKWARAYIRDNKQGAAPKQPADVLTKGDIIYVRQHEDAWLLAQQPQVSSAFVAIEPTDGAILALVGGYSFNQSQFNRVTQAQRQIGSNIKPFLYATALEQSHTLASLINNAPITQWDKSQGTAWRPKNSPDIYTGPTRLRIGLAQSINVMAVRLLREVGLTNTISSLKKYGFKGEIPKNESIALGSASVTPLEAATSFAIFANGGFLVEPYFIESIETDEQVLYRAAPKYVCSECLQPQASPTSFEQAFDELSSQLIANLQLTQPNNDFCHIDSDFLAPSVLSEQVSFLIYDALKSVVWGGGDWSKGTGWNGTAWRAARLIDRHDIGGKTGTTNDARDTWFSGFGPNIVATSWMGFDDHNRSLGRTSWNNNDSRGQITGAESGAKSAGPAWNHFMHQYLQDIPVQHRTIPANITTTRIDLETGLLSRKTDHTSRFEYFVKGSEPEKYVDDQVSQPFESDIFNDGQAPNNNTGAIDELFE